MALHFAKNRDVRFSATTRGEDQEEEEDDEDVVKDSNFQKVLSLKKMKSLCWVHELWPHIGYKHWPQLMLPTKGILMLQGERILKIPVLSTYRKRKMDKRVVGCTVRPV